MANINRDGSRAMGWVWIGGVVVRGGQGGGALMGAAGVAI